VDVEEDVGYEKTFRGVENLDTILTVFDEFGLKATLFTTGEVLESYPNLIERWSRKHEIACHGYYHVSLHELSISEREKQLGDFCNLYQKILGRKPKGFRTRENIIDDAQLRLLERLGFAYDSSVVPRYVPLRRYIGFKGKAPVEPYHPSHQNCREKGDMKILEIPLSPLIFGIPLIGTWIRVFSPGSYRALLTLKKPEFISLAMHSWDTVEYQGSFSRNTGGRFAGYLESMLKMLTECYNLMSGEQIASVENQE